MSDDEEAAAPDDAWMGAGGSESESSDDDEEESSEEEEEASESSRKLRDTYDVYDMRRALSSMLALHELSGKKRGAESTAAMLKRPKMGRTVRPPWASPPPIVSVRHCF